MRYLVLAICFLSLEALAEPQSQDSFTLSSFSFNEPWEHYKVAIFSDGVTVLIIENDTYEARSFQLPNTPETFAQIIAALGHFKFDSFSDSYGLVNGVKDPKCKELWSHGNISLFALQYDGKRKVVHYNHGCKGFGREEELQELANRLKVILGLSGYVGL
ncbi:hypothetical protein J6I75_09795 [Pseudidiomarina sp. 1APP75-27a]|uniref:hypothetical protein n=1 Tax=Pseudidiomarina terrestris TaxID=2820060 RepID=UPI002B05201E|nr:hypothetical protein [Pseudidiomarina sp. 1APP75-27a]MEA3588647.1 hypothetical protein [Pseudidiomarina sp. 1APP75-27a]